MQVETTYVHFLSLISIIFLRNACNIHMNIIIYIKAILITYLIVPCPEMIRAPRNVTVLPGETADFYCLSLSFSGLIYEWKRLGNSKLPSSALKTYKIWKFSSFFGRFTTLYHLEIKNTESSHEGWYCCEATNECSEAATECGWLEVSSKLTKDNNT